MSAACALIFSMIHGLAITVQFVKFFLSNLSFVGIY